MTFVFGAKSESKLLGVHPDLVRVARTALTYTTIDFGILQGLRTLSEEYANFDKGLSRIVPTQSRHLRGMAIDIGAYQGHTLSWEWSLYNYIADAFRSAAYQEHVPIRWGGAWNGELTQAYMYSSAQHEDYVSQFVQDNPGCKPLCDGGHFELPVKEYP